MRGQADADATARPRTSTRTFGRALVAGRALPLGRRGRALHRRAPRVPRGVRRARARARRAGTRPACTTASSARSRRTRWSARGDRRRAAADLRHPRPAHAAAGPRDVHEASRATRFTWQRVRRRARVRPRHRPALRPRGDRRRVRRDGRVLPAGPVILYDHPASANCLKARVAAAPARHPVRDASRSTCSAGETRQPEHLARNPDGRVPVLELDSGDLIPESGAILLLPRRGHAVPARRPARARARAPVAVLRAEPGRGGLAVARFMALDGPRRSSTRRCSPTACAQRPASAGVARARPVRRAPVHRRRRLHGRRHRAPRLRALRGRRGRRPREYARDRAWLERVEATPGFVNDLAPIP